MRAPLSWLKEFVDIPASVTAEQISDGLIRVGFEVEEIIRQGADLIGPLKFAKVLSIEEITEFKKPIRYVGLDCGEGQTRYVICGATNFSVGDLIVAALPGAVLPGDFTIGARETYGKTSNGMICSGRELGISDDHAGIMVFAESEVKIGADAIEVSQSDRTATIGNVVVKEGDMISIDGSTGHVYLGELAVVPSPVSNYLENGLEVASATDDAEISALVKAVDRILKHADSVRRLNIRTNADTAEDARWARNLGAEGIGLCRTEHMFLGDRRVLIERVILADNTLDRTAALDALLPMQQKDFEELFEAMDDLPVTVRLLDPPLHEFLPDRADLMVEVALGKVRNEDVSKQELLLTAVDRLHESNPMLGLRGVRLGLVVPGLFSMQVRAIANAAITRLRAGGNPKVEIMIPLVGSVMELHLIRDEMDVLLAQIAKDENINLPFAIGTMIELPRAALTAQRIAEAAEFFSFGTNDLTQTTWGFSRDDVEASFFATYLDRGIFTVSPFESLDVDGVGALIKIAVDKGRATRPDIKLGVCGEHGGDPESIRFFHDVGLDYVSCSPFRVPVARLEAGRVSIS
jgi:pyruvate,orthophosphate dikinase